MSKKMSTGKMHPMRLVHPAWDKLRGRNLQREVKVAFDLDQKQSSLSVKFSVHGPVAFTNRALSKDESVWGLWDWDVVELFLQPRADEPTYYEFIVSPLNQNFELQIFEPRKKFDKSFRSGFFHDAVVHSEKLWTAELSVPLEKLGWDGNPKSLRGNAFAILGEKPRTYWSLFLPPQMKPDFHLPSYFEELLEA